MYLGGDNGDVLNIDFESWLQKCMLLVKIELDILNGIVLVYINHISTVNFKSSKNISCN